MGNDDLESPAPLTQLLEAVSAGDLEAGERLLPLVYDELHRLAHVRRARLAPGQTLLTTDLVHEAWMRLCAGGQPSWDSKAHFFGAAANAMRNILVEQARRRSSQKRDAARKRPLSGDLPEITPEVEIEDVVALHEALQKFEVSHERPARVVMLRFFTGLAMPAVADVLGASLATVERDWRFARSWLQREIDGTAERP